MSDSDPKSFGTPNRKERSDHFETGDDGTPVPLSPPNQEQQNEALNKRVTSTPSPSNKTLYDSTGAVPLTPISTPFPMDDIPLPSDQIVSWPMTLQSPTLPSFSPSVVSNKAMLSYHGTGLLLCINRSHQVNKTTKRCVSVLQEVGNLYDQYAASLSKAAQMLPSPTSALNDAASSAGLSEPVPLVALQQSLGTWSKDKSKVARHIRSAIAGLVQNYLATQNDTLVAIQQRYAQCRSTCSYSRGRALSSYKKYVKALKDSEQLIVESQNRDRVGDEEESTNEPQCVSASNPVEAQRNAPAKFTKRAEAKLTESLKRYRQYENRYKSRVKWENECVTTCQRLEAMGLDTVQQMEEDRLTILVTTIIKVLSAQKQALDTGIISLSTDVAPENTKSDGPTEGGPGKKSARKFVKMLTESKNSFLNEEESTGAMDAETLGLSDEIGELRDGVRKRLALRRERILLAKTMSLFFEAVIKASTKIGQSLRDLLKKENSNVSESLPVAMGAANEGAHVLLLWDGLTSFLEAEADGCYAMADSLRNLRAAKLDSVILYGEKAMKATGESDDLAWKNLCEAARTQAKAENRFRQSSVESARARERVASLDGGLQQVEEEQKDTKEKMFSGKLAGKRVQKGLANLASLLPTASDHASKMLGPEARASVAQKVLKDAHEKEGKEKQQLTAAVEATSAALLVYKSDAENACSRYDDEEKRGWQDIQSSIESFAELAQKLLGTLQLESISDLKPIFAKTRSGIATDINEWRMKAQQELVAICVDCNVSDDSADSGFSLQLMLHSSDAVNKYMDSTNVEVDVERVDENEEATDDELEDDGAEEPSPDNGEDAEPEETMDSNGKGLFKRPVFAPGSQFAARGKRPQKKLKGPLSGTEHADPETDLFLTYFWPDPVDPKNVPTIVNSFACSFRDGAQALPTQYGRVYLSSARMIFTSWSKKKLNLKWEEVNELKESRSFEEHADDALQVLCKPKGSAEDSCMVLDGFTKRREALDVMLDLKEKARLAAEAQNAPPVAEESISEAGGPVAPDPVMPKMHKVLSKHLRNISIQKFHEIAWSEKTPLLQPWLEKEAFDVEVGEWQDIQTKGPWCRETYQSERKIKFKVKRRTHLYIGPPIANVSQTHRCRMVGNDRCIVSMTIEFDGIPFSDTFAVEVRWAALRESGDDIKIECGLFVDFRKKTYLKSKIQAGTIEESTPVYKNFFTVVQTACVAAGGTQALDEVEEPDDSVKPQKSTFESAKDFFHENPQYIHLAAVVLGLSLMFLWRLFGRRTSGGVENADLQLLLQRVDTLEAKLDTMLELIQALKESNLQVLDSPR
mmetsp:Transcript_13072/g.29657  ORF Transcript_13072/g.29657 Transcript_13072/m.29657 type:complete len:1321 (+) Transcript_13072:186-4148(+)